MNNNFIERLIGMNAKELTQKYIAEGKDSVSAWWWARNPSNRESPHYSKIEAKRCDIIMAKLING